MSARPSAALPPLGQSRLGALTRRWRLLALLVVGFAPFVPSLLSERDFLLADNALGFVPFMLPLAAYLFWVHGHVERRPGRRDVLLDVFFALPLLLGALFVLIVSPARLSWYFWLNRVDLLALGLFVTGVAVVFLGYQQVLRVWPAVVALFLGWPYAVVWVQNQIGAAFVAATSWVADRMVGFLRLPYVYQAGSGDVLTSTHLPAGQNFTLVIGQLCAGTAAVMGFALLGAGLVLLLRGPWGRRLRWYLLGVALAFVLNLLRVTILLTLAARTTRHFAVDIVHPVIGVVFFLGLVAGMLALLPSFGLGLDLRPHGEHTVWEPVAGGGRPLAVLQALAVVVAVAVGVLVVQVQQYAFIGIGNGAPAVDITATDKILPQLPGWTLTHVTTMSWTDLFGRSSRGDVWDYADAAHPGNPFATVQTIVANDTATLDRYSIEQCIDFHGRTLDGRQVVSLGHGVEGVLIQETFQGTPSSTLYWLMPVNVNGVVQDARIALFSDVTAPLPAKQAAAPGTNSAARVGAFLENVMETKPLLDRNPKRAVVDRDLVDLAGGIIAQMLATGGPAS